MRKFKIIGIALYLLFLRRSTADVECLPELTRKTTATIQRGDNVVFLCAIRSCKTLSTVIYEKTDLKLPSTWTPVYEAMNSPHHHALVTGFDYNLSDRAEHSVLDSHFLLELRDVSVKDNGRWRCVVVDKNNIRHESIALPLAVVNELNLTITPAKPELVVYQSDTFTCEIKGIYPEPNFEWIFNGTTHLGNTQLSERRADGLWYAVNTAAKLDFDAPGQAILICVLTTQNGDPLLHTNITVDVKAPAQISYPKQELLITTNGSSPVEMTCSGLGYKPHITWQHNGVDIRSDNQRHISTDSNSSICTGTVTLTPIDLPLTCQKLLHYSGNYTCNVTLEPPYKSSQTSHPIRVKILHKPILKEPPKTVYIGESKTATLRCEVCSTTTTTSMWTFKGEKLKGPNVEHQEDGSVILTGYHTPGEYNRTVHNKFGSFSCIVDVVHTGINIFHTADHQQYLTIAYSVLSALGLLLVMLALWQVGKRLKGIRKRLHLAGRHERTDEEMRMVRTVLDLQFPDSPKSAIVRQTLDMKEHVCSIWRSTQPDYIFVSGQNSPTITVIDDCAELSSHCLPKGTSIVNGLSINQKNHFINVYDETLNTHSIYCVSIDLLSTDGQLTIKATLKLSNEIKEPRCIFAIDKSSVGIYCARKRMIGVFNTKDIQNPSSAGVIKLTGYDANQKDLLCVNPDAHICVLSYKYCLLYIFDKHGKLMYNFNTGMDDPVHIQSFSDNSLVAVNLYGEIHRFDEDGDSKIIKYAEDTYVQSAVFTKSLLLVIDALDSTKIHVLNTGVV